MTALCGGGTSSSKAGAAAVVNYTAGLIAAIFATYDIAWLIPIIPLVGLAPLTLSTFCASDPPATPTFTSAETNALLQLQFGSDFDSGLAKVKDLILNVIWHDTCQCTSGSPTPLSPPAPPAGTPITQFPLPPATAPCYDTAPFNHSGISGGTFTIGGLTPPVGLVPTAYVVRLKSTVTVAPGTTLTITGQSQHGSGPPTVDATASVNLAPGTEALLVVKYPPISTTTILSSAVLSGSGTEVVSTQEQFYCGSNPTQLQQACCPPDPATQSYLDNILQLVTLIQRQIVPFAYVAGTVHTGLSGSGVLNVHGLLGVKVVITTDPTTLGVEGTSPPILFDRGFLTWGTTDGYPQSERLERTNQLSLPARASAFTELAYDLHPGVIVTITELVREA